MKLSQQLERLKEELDPSNDYTIDTGSMREDIEGMILEAQDLEWKISTLQQKLARLHSERVIETLDDIDEDSKKSDDDESKLFLREHLQPELQQLRQLIFKAERSDNG